MTQVLAFRIAAFAGGLSLLAYLISIPLFGLESGSSSPNFFDSPVYDFGSLLVYVFYLNGFATMGEKFKNRLLTNAARAIVWLNVLAAAVFYAAIQIETLDSNVLTGIETLLGVGISAGMLVLGWQVLNLKTRLGTLAVWYGCLALLSALGLTFFFLPIGIAVESILYGLGTILLYRLSLSQK